MGAIVSAAGEQVRAFVSIARRLEYQHRSGGAWTELSGVLRKPTLTELSGAIDSENRVVMFAKLALESAAGANTPGKGDRVRGVDEARVFVVQSKFDTRYAGPNPTFMVAEVRG